jgi:hypothetical protein
MSDLLRDYERKRGRAMLHFNVLRESLEAFTNIDREPVRGKPDRDASKYVFEVPLEPVDPDWVLIVGEFVYNTRASLDYLITALVRSTGKEEKRSNQFPIYGLDVRGVPWQDLHQWWDTSGKVSGQLKDTPSETKAALKELQPFYGVPATDPTRHPLFALNLMSNRDKHRRLNLLAYAARFQFIDALGKPIFDGPPADGRIPDTYKGGTYTVSLARHADVDMYLLPTYDVALHEAPELIGNLIETLAGINEFIDSRVLPAVAALLKVQDGPLSRAK